MPPKYVLIAARRWLQLLVHSSPSSAMGILMSEPEYADLSASNYREAHEWLLDRGLLGLQSEQVDDIRLEVFIAAISDGNLDWLNDGIDAIPSPDFLPGPVLASIDALGLSTQVAWRAALDVGAKIDLERRARIGLHGELALVRHLEDLGCYTDHISLRMDGLGWDVLARRDGAEAHIEVKSTTSLSRLRIYLSRNEFEVARTDHHWHMIIALIDEEGRLLRVAHVAKQVLPLLVPSDSSALGRWQSCSLDLNALHIEPGLPPAIAMNDHEGIIERSTEPVWWPSAS
jgi:hypothetical protein